MIQCLFSRAQEQVEQSVHEKAELQKALDQMRAENEALKGALQREQQEVSRFKVRLSSFPLCLRDNSTLRNRENGQTATEL